MHMDKVLKNDESLAFLLCLRLFLFLLLLLLVVFSSQCLTGGLFCAFS